MKQSLLCPGSIVETYRSELARLCDALPVDRVTELAELIWRVTREAGTIYVFGNGGSAATASHMGCDFLKNTRVPGMPPVRCIDLGANASSSTAFANDEGYAQVFAAPLRSLGRPGDLAIAISASGDSPNILQALRAARDLGMRTAALLGFGGGKARPLADFSLVVGSDFVPRIEDLHLIVSHMLTECLRAHLQQHARQTHEKSDPIPLDAKAAVQIVTGSK
jgi:D-sedoheptulose 7-phosphate isomerase